ncbi:MAG TPA: ASKHA domain-containing protein [Clostridia bacterium]|nr:MAG: Na(+)-translocating NADH-quinone reductase subunit F [Firmicutes bacterium ADurb.Bin146]HOD93564.1 ASKHA domain-containing protein [Clostridia bacterium]
MTIKILTDTKTFEFEPSNLKHPNIYSLIKSIPEIDFIAPCGGGKRCGKCKIRLMNDKSDISASEQVFLTQKEIEDNIRLACFVPISDGQIIDLTDIKAVQSIMTDNKLLNSKIVVNPIITYGYGVAVDIGTTTVAASLYDLQTAKRLSVASDVNKQARFGSDVISRIQFASTKENLMFMQDTILNEVNSLIQKLCSDTSVGYNEINLVAIAGNTTMQHLFMGLDPTGIGVAPFTPVTLDTHIFDYDAPELKSIIKINNNGKIIVCGSIASYVGADILAGILATGIHMSDKPCVLLDIGTNGEIVLGSKNKIYSCATAAGPAFEGANISCGVAGIQGAINSVSYDDVNKFTTIGDKKPVGICGSGLIDAIYSMLKNGIIEESGYMESSEGFMITNNVILTQKDVREVQNAKAAIAAGLKILIKRSGYKYSDIDKVYLAGGFGTVLNVESSTGIGLIPLELKQKVVPAGNTSLTGITMLLLDKTNIETIDNIRNLTEYIELSQDSEFTDEYVDNMFFEV